MGRDYTNAAMTHFYGEHGEVVEEGSAQDPRTLPPVIKPPRYLVTLIMPRGTCLLEVPTFQGPAAAGRRAKFAAVSQGWGNLDEVLVGSVAVIE